MRTWRALTTISLAAAVVGLESKPSAAQQDWSCVLTGYVLGCIVTRVDTPGGPSTSVQLGDTSIFWSRIQLSPDDAWSGEECQREGPAVIDGVEVELQETGTRWLVGVVNTDEGRDPEDWTSWNSYDVVCEWPGEEPPQPPPDPPTVAQIAEAFAEAIEVPAVLSPPAEFGGVTGLDLWFWCDAPAPQTLNQPLSLGGWTVEATMTPMTYTWLVSGPESSSGSNTQCGHAPDPQGDSGAGAAWIWQPQVRGEYQIALTTGWMAEYSLTYDFGTGPIDLGTHVHPDLVEVAGDSVVYPIREHRGTLTRPGDG